MVVCFPGAKIEVITERAEKILVPGKGGFILVHVGINDAEREGTTAIVRKYRQLVKQTWVKQIILSGILPVMAAAVMFIEITRGWQLTCLFSGYVGKRKLDLWGCFVGRTDMFMRDGLHLSRKGAAVFANELSVAVDSGMGSINNIFGSKHCLN